jgi:hypothetical protein
MPRRSLAPGSCGFARTASGSWAGSSRATVRRERSESDGNAVFRHRLWAPKSRSCLDAIRLVTSARISGLLREDPHDWLRLVRLWRIFSGVGVARVSVPMFLGESAMVDAWIEDAVRHGETMVMVPFMPTSAARTELNGTIPGRENRTKNCVVLLAIKSWLYMVPLFVYVKV